MDNFHKSEIVSEIYENVVGASREEGKKCRVTFDDVAFCVDEFLKSVKSALIGGKSVELRGFGTFLLKRRAAKSNSRNVRTGEAVESREHSVVIFRPGAELRSATRDLDVGE